MLISVFPSSVCPPGPPGPRGRLEVPGDHGHPGGEEEREGEAPLPKEKDADQADQAGGEKRREQDRKVHRRSETIRRSRLNWLSVANKNLSKCLQNASLAFFGHIFHFECLFLYHSVLVKL